MPIEGPWFQPRKQVGAHFRDRWQGLTCSYCLGLTKSCCSYMMDTCMVPVWVPCRIRPLTGVSQQGTKIGTSSRIYVYVHINMHTYIYTHTYIYIYVYEVCGLLSKVTWVLWGLVVWPRHIIVCNCGWVLGCRVIQVSEVFPYEGFGKPSIIRTPQNHMVATRPLSSEVG